MTKQLKIKLLQSHATQPLPEIVEWLALNIPDIKTLDLRSSARVGHIPAAIGQLTELEKIDLANNYITGPIPDDIGLLKKLQVLNLQSNRLTGSIPARLGECVSLRKIYLNENRLSGEIPEKLCEIPHIDVFNLWLNPWLEGQIPAGLDAARIDVGGTLMTPSPQHQLRIALLISERLGLAGVHPVDIAITLNNAGHVTATGGQWTADDVSKNWSAHTKQRIAGDIETFAPTHWT